MLDKNREVARKCGIALRHTNPLNLKTRINLSRPLFGFSKLLFKRTKLRRKFDNFGINRFGHEKPYFNIRN